MKIRSLRVQLFLAICLVAIIPVIIVSSFSLGNTIRIVNDKVNELTKNNLEQVDKNINITLDGHEDLLFQLCTDDSIIELVEMINSNKNVEFYTSQLIARFHEISRIKSGLISVMLITKDVEKEMGVIVFSINEEVLKQICNENSDGTENVDSMNFIVDEKQKILSYPDNQNIGEKVKQSADRKNSYESFVAKTEVLKGKKHAINYVTDQKSGWSIINVMDYDVLLKEIKTQRSITGIIILCSFLVLVCISILLSYYLTSSIQKNIAGDKKDLKWRNES